MLAAPDGFHRGEGMVMVRRGDDHPVNLFDFIEHLPVVGELARARVLFEGVGRVVLVNITQRHNVLILQFVEITGPLASDADAGQVELSPGAAAPRRPETEPGTSAKAAADRAVPRRNCRRVSRIMGVVVFIRRLVN